MPIKLPKGFQRRKSSGNALEENPNPPQPSFRVFERPPDSRKSIDGVNALKRMTDGRPASEGQYKPYVPEKPGLNRESGGTQISNSTTGLYDTASSARLSSSSTLPSSASFEAGLDEIPHAHPKPPQKAAAPSGFSLRAAGRTFSFGARKAAVPPVPSLNDIPLPQQHPHYSDIPDVNRGVRQRAMTETSYASGSTATPPKILDSDFVADNGDGFGDIFASVNGEKRKSPLQVQNDAARYSVKGQVFNQIQQNVSAPIQPDVPENITHGPYHGVSHLSKDGFITATPQQENVSDHDITSPGPSVNSTRTLVFDGSSSQGDEIQDQNLFLRQSKTLEPQTSPSLFDEDTRLAMRFMGTSEPRAQIQANHLPSKPLPRKPLSDTYPQRGVTLYDGQNQDHQELEISRGNSVTATPKAKQATVTLEEDGITHDLDLQQMALSADRFQTRSTSPPPQRLPPPKAHGKIMTPAQFERYRREQESLRSQFAAASDSEEEDVNSDKYDDDEEERNKEMARQRRRQDAQMSVYRQQMMKVTGEQQPLNSGVQRAVHSGNSLIGGVGTNDRTSWNKSSEEDEDEDIPLGILAAHGFPSKERPPSHLSRVGSQPNIRYTSETYPPPPPSTSGVSVRESTSMPAFARNLPKDPFYGASLVSPTDRQSLAFGSGSLSAHGGSQVQQTPSSGGLVGVIAKEERARAMRRGSPNAATLEMPGGVQQPLNSVGSASGPSSAEHQAQIQMSQQMTHMMQMQMQWMQQMMALQGIQGHQLPQMPPMPQFPGVPGMPQMGIPTTAQMPSGMPPAVQSNGSRPPSAGDFSVTGLPQRPHSSAHSISMLSPDPQTWNPRNSRTTITPSTMGPSGRNSALSHGSGHGQIGAHQHSSGYAASLAPSERSNVGLASRYRPVSTTPAPENSGRTSTMGSGALRAWESQDKGKAAATLRVVPAKKNDDDDDDDDDEGWEDMRRKREKKQSQWKGRKADKAEENALEGVFYPTNID